MLTRSFLRSRFQITAARSLTAKREFSLRPVETPDIPAAPSNPPSFAASSCIAVSSANSTGDKVEIGFSDGSCFQFHSLWLRDACRDAGSVQASSERVLDASPLPARIGDVAATTANIEGGDLKIGWSTGPVSESHFNAQFLRTYANIVAKPIDASKIEVEGDFFDFLDQNRGMKREDLTLWGNDESFEVHTYDYNKLDSNHNDLMKSLMNPGFVIVENMPEDPKYDGSGLSTFAAKYLGGLQKHPLRETAHWTISTEATTHDDSNMLADADMRKGANSYNTSQQLCNHTDQSLYGLPGILLGFHCAMGEGNNSLTDGFAVAYAMKDRFPEEYNLLATHGMNAGRRLEYYNSNDLHFNTQHKVLNEDADGNLMRVQYHEIYRTPSTLSFDDFPKYFNALRTFYSLVHSPEFQVGIKLQEGQCLMMNNWRTMHGRAGLAGKKRTILGGTVTREAFYSQVRRLRQQELSIAPELECGLPVTYYKTLANSK